MASAIRQMTGVGGDVRKIARLLQKKAPPGHMLAYINQEEADLLKARGGSGKPHEDTGVPSFETEDPSVYLPEYSDIPWSQREVPSSEQQAFTAIQAPTQHGAYLPTRLPSYGTADVTSAAAPAAPAAVDVPMTDASSGYYRPYYADPVAPAAAEITAPPRDVFATPRETGARESFDTSIIAPGGSQAPTPQDKDLLGKAQDYFSNLSPETKKLLGQTAAGSIPALIGAYTTQQAAEQARKAKEEMMARSAPYKAQADEMITKARSGQLTPVGQQQLQAVQAQAAQAAQGRGGVAAQQAMTQVEAYRQQLLQGQYDYGLKLAGISDQIAMGAIKTGLEADRYINAATMDYFNNAIRMFQGQSPQVAGRQPTDTTAPRG